jgi:DNA-binding LytR/AlgR family response regulator
LKIIIEQSQEQELEVVIRGDGQMAMELAGYLSQYGREARRIVGYQDGREFFLSPKDICYFEACDGKINAVCLNHQIYTVKKKLYEVEELTRHMGFLRISKHVVVNMAWISSVEAEFSGNYLAYTKDGTRLSISRSYMKQFRSAILGE